MEAIASFVWARSSPYGREVLLVLEAFKDDGGIRLDAQACRGYIATIAGEQHLAKHPASVRLGFRLEARLLAGVLRKARRAAWCARRVAYFETGDQRDQT